MCRKYSFGFRTRVCLRWAGIRRNEDRLGRRSGAEPRRRLSAGFPDPHSSGFAPSRPLAICWDDGPMPSLAGGCRRGGERSRQDGEGRRAEGLHGDDHPLKGSTATNHPAERLRGDDHPAERLRGDDHGFDRVSPAGRTRWGALRSRGRPALQPAGIGFSGSANARGGRRTASVGSAQTPNRFGLDPPSGGKANSSGLYRTLTAIPSNRPFLDAPGRSLLY